MKKKSWYAVRKGRREGLYRTWDECRKQVIGYPGASYKGFYTQEEAEAFLGGGAREPETAVYAGGENPDSFVAYVDGSFMPFMPGVFSFGCVILYKGKTETYGEKIEDKEEATMRNVAGEIHGTAFAMKNCLERGVSVMELYYDYAGIEKWCTGEWKANKKGTKALKAYYDSIKNRLTVHFHKVPSHTGVKYNEMADQLAKGALLARR